MFLWWNIELMWFQVVSFFIKCYRNYQRSNFRRLCCLKTFLILVISIPNQNIGVWEQLHFGFMRSLIDVKIRVIGFRSRIFVFLFSTKSLDFHCMNLKNNRLMNILWLRPNNWYYFVNLYIFFIFNCFLTNKLNNEKHNYNIEPSSGCSTKCSKGKNFRRVANGRKQGKEFCSCT